MSETVFAEGEPRPSKLPIILGIIGLFIIGVIGFLFLTPAGKKLLGKEADQIESSTERVDIQKVAFTQLPEILINLRTADGRSSFLKATFVVESPSEEISKKIDKIKPLLVDQFQIFLRELDVDDLKGSAGMMRVRQELLSRANSLVAPEKVSNVLFKEFLIQ